MINFSRSANCPEKSYLFEVMGTEISTRVKLPRHISCWETESHHNLKKPNRIKQLSQTCRLNARQSEATNLAVNMIKYQLKDRLLRQKHFQNVQYNLQHRLEVAQATGNSQLVSILQEEFKQLQAGI